MLALSAGALQALGVLGVAAVTGVVTLLVARRSTSGSISTSDAATLWAESSSIRRELRERVAVLEAENTNLRERVQSLESEVLALKREQAGHE